MNIGPGWAHFLSMLFWAELLWIITLSIPCLLCLKVLLFINLSCIKLLRSFIFNIHLEENQGFATPSLRRSYVINPKPVKTLQAKEINLHYSLPLAAKSPGDITRLPKSPKFCSKTCCVGRMVNRLPKRISTPGGMAEKCPC